MSETGAEKKTKNIVIFGANGGIGQDLLRRLTEKVADGENYHITIVTRRGESFNEALIQEQLESLKLKDDRVKGDVLADVVAGPYFDPKNLAALEPVLKDADMVVCAAGLPRPSPPPARMSLIYPNAPLVKNIAEAMAKYAKADTPLLLGTNPLDNTVQIADKALREAWQENGRAEKLPEVKVIGMSGNLDGARLQINAAKILNQALRAAGKGASSYREASKTEKIYIRPQDIEGHVYGQHGDEMAVDVASVKVKGKYLQDFIRENGIEHSSVTVNIKGKKQEMQLGRAVDEATRDGGAFISRGLKRTTQIGGAGQIFSMIEDYFGDEMKKIDACAVSDFAGYGQKTAYGRPVKIGGGKIEIDDFPASVLRNDFLKERIRKSHEVIREGNDYYEQCKAAEDHIREVVGGDRLSISRESPPANDDGKKAYDLRVEISGLSSEKLESIKGDLQIITQADKNSFKPDGNKLSMVIKSNVTAPLDTLAEALGSKVDVKNPEIAKVASAPGKMVDDIMELVNQNSEGLAYRQ